MRGLKLVVAGLGMVFAGSAHAGIYTDDVSRCLVDKTTEPDRVTIIRWIFSAVSVNPAVKDLIVLKDDQRAKMTKSAADVFNRLILVDCRTKMVAALKNEGASVFEASFGVLGQVAMRGLMNDPAVTMQLQHLGTAVDPANIVALFKEAGLATEDKAPSPATK